ncbi:MAG: haloacid dehalogenase [Acidilobaceae archaeon]
MSYKYIEQVMASIDSYLRERDSVREEVIRVSRDIVRLSKQIILLIQFNNLDEAVKRAQELDSIVSSMISKLNEYPDILYSGLTYNAISEYVEAQLLLDIARNEPIRGFRELRIPPVPYLQGLGDLVGELRRLILEKIKVNDYSEAWRLFKVMETIYMSLSKLEYPEALIPGVRHKVDIARRIVDETLAFILDLESRSRLQESLGSARRVLEF